MNYSHAELGIAEPLTAQQLLGHDTLLPRIRPRRRRQSPAEKPFRPEQRLFRYLSMLDRQRILHLRFGSLANIGRRPRMEYKEIGKRLRIPPTTVRRSVLQFLERGRDYSRLGLGLRRSFKAMSARLQRHLLYPPLLQEWAPYSLAERSRIITEVWGEAVSETQLHRFYRHNQVRFLTAKLRYKYAQLNRPGLDARRR